MFVAVERDVERAAHIGGGSFELHRAAVDRYFADGKVVFFGKLFDFIYVGGIGAMPCREVSARSGRNSRLRYGGACLRFEND